MKAHRSPLMVEVSVPSADATAAPYQLTLFVVHMKSGRDFGFWREAESKKLLSLIAETTKDRPDRNIAVLGDFNAADDAASIAILKSGGLTDLSPTGKSSPGKPDKATISHASGRTIDHLMVNANLLKEIVPASEFVLGTPTRPEGTDYRNTPTPPGYASDHFPVVVDLIPKD
jgi:endonuclease/exonuclease/phosphatase family metal-dependent hydrolase